MTRRRRRATLASALFAFAVLPGAVAFIVPLSIAASQDTGTLHPWGLVLTTIGVFLLARTIIEFYATGHGTLAPWDPPRRVVTSGPYQWCRNPMYVSVLTIVSGWAVVFGSAVLGIYTAEQPAPDCQRSADRADAGHG